MKVAVMFTGALRTITKTMAYFKDNVLLNPDVHVYLCVQNDTIKPDSEWTEWFHTQMGANLKSIQWFSLNDGIWVAIREKMLKNIPIENHWKQYLRSSGSMIEYYQLQQAYESMFHTEVRTGTRYDYIIRCRTDTIYCKPVDFHWLSWTRENISERIVKIKSKLEELSIETDASKIMNYFMTTILHDNTITNLCNIIYQDVDSQMDSELLHLDTLIDTLLDYIKNGRYILTFRVNLLYIVRRDLFNLIPCLGTFYGLLRSINYDQYWFNSEGQLQAVCEHSNLTIFNYRTILEDQSLYEYNQDRYFDSQYKLKSPNMLYLLVRN